MSYIPSWNTLRLFIYMFLALSALLKNNIFITIYYILSCVAIGALWYVADFTYLIYISIVTLFFILAYSYSTYNSNIEDSYLPVITSIITLVSNIVATPKQQLINQGFLYIVSVTTGIILVLVSLLNIALVLFQRGEEGVFSRDSLSNQYASEDKTMNNSTIFFGIIYLILNFILGIILFILNQA